MRATSLGEVLRVAGINQRDVDFDKAVALAVEKFLASGGTNEGAAMRLQWIVERMSGMGQDTNVERVDQGTFAQTRQPLEDGEASKLTPPSGHLVFAPSSSSERGGDGRIIVAPLGQKQNAIPARTARGLSSIKLVQPTIKQGLLELKKTADGRAWGGIGWHELDGMDRDGAIARLVKSSANPPKDRHAPLRSFLSNKQFEEICDAAKKQNDFV